MFTNAALHAGGELAPIYYTTSRGGPNPWAGKGEHQLLLNAKNFKDQVGYLLD